MLYFARRLYYTKNLPYIDGVVYADFPHYVAYIVSRSEYGMSAKAVQINFEGGITMKSAFGLNENIAAAISYLLGPISGIIMLVVERENKFVRFHALQSTLWFLFMWIIFWVVGIVTGIPFIGLLLRIIAWPVMWIWRVVFVGSRLFLMFKAATSSEYKLPFVGEVAWNQVNK